MEFESLRREIRKTCVPQEYLYIARELDDVEVRGRLYKDFSKIPGTFLELMKIACKVRGHVPQIEFTDDVNMQFVELIKNDKVKRISYDQASDRIEMVKSVVDFFEVFDKILDAVKGFSILENLSMLVSDSLKMEKLDDIIFMFLTALTVGYGFGFTRAAFFRRESGFFVGSMAIGPFDEGEAKNFWEEFRYDHYDLEELVKHLRKEFPRSRLQRYVSSVRFYVSSEEGVFFDRNGLKIVPIESIPKSVKEKLFIDGEIVVLPLNVREKSLGFFVADNKFTKRVFSSRSLRILAQFHSQMALIVENLLLKEDLRKLSYSDALTGVGNRRIIENVKSVGDVLIMIDLDDFKKVNDTRGHEAGDKLLKRFATLARKSLRSEDIVLRYGGDEFVLILKGASLSEAERVVKRLQKSAQEISLRFSAGVAKVRNSIEEAMKIADKLMYKAKKTKKGFLKEEETN